MFSINKFTFRLLSSHLTNYAIDFNAVFIYEQSNGTRIFMVKLYHK